MHCTATRHTILSTLIYLHAPLNGMHMGADLSTYFSRDLLDFCLPAEGRTAHD